jgi:plasmid stability protein
VTSVTTKVDVRVERAGVDDQRDDADSERMISSTRSETSLRPLRPAAAAPSLASMRSACDHQDMASMIQIRNVPDELHRDLKVRAARSGMTLSDFLLAELRSLSVRPTMREWLDRTATWEPVDVSESPAEALAAERSRHVA